MAKSRESIETQPARVRIPHLLARKQRGERITMLTAYDATMARLLDRAGIDVLLVGDSLGTVIMGYDTTLPVTLEAVIHHTKAVSTGARRALVVADMPFLTYQVELSEAVRNAGRLLQEGGAAAVKLEGGVAVADTVRRLVSLGIPVMGHVGLTPQSVHQLGGFRAVGKTQTEADQVMEDARALQQAGVFAVVLESMPAAVADAAEVRDAGRRILLGEEQIRVEYFDVVDAEEMQPVVWISGRVCIAAAVWLGETRLIDNVLWEVNG